MLSLLSTRFGRASFASSDTSKPGFTSLLLSCRAQASCSRHKINHVTVSGSYGLQLKPSLFTSTNYPQTLSLCLLVPLPVLPARLSLCLASAFCMLRTTFELWSIRQCSSSLTNAQPVNNASQATLDYDSVRSLGIVSHAQM